MKKYHFNFYTFVIIISIFVSGISFSQTNENLNGSRFKGKAEEQTPPDVDRMPIVLDEIVSFENGAVTFEVMKKYSLNSCSYTAEIDERRMIAVKVVNVNSECQSIYNGENVTVKFSGNIYGDLWMSGNVVIEMQDNTEVKFFITAEAQ